MQFKLFGILTVLASVLLSTSVWAQDPEFEIDNHKTMTPNDPGVRDKQQRPFHSSEGAKYGVIGNIGRPAIGGSSLPSSELQLQDSAIDQLTGGGGNDDRARARNELLGCSTMDYHASVITSLNNDQDQIQEYVDSPMGTYMLTTILNSPQIAATFNAVEAFGGKRVQLMQDRCQAMQSDATVSAEGMMRWQALQACVARNVDSNLNTTVASASGSARNRQESVAVALAYRACLYGAQGQDDSFSTEDVTAFGVSVSPSPNSSLEGSLQEDVLSFDGDTPSLWTGTLFHALDNTAFCAMTGGGGGADAEVGDTIGNDCALMALIPNVRWCAGSERYERTCLNDQSTPRMSRATLNPQQVFDMVYSLTQVEMNYRDTFAKEMIKRMDKKYRDQVAFAGERLQEPMLEATVDNVEVSFLTNEVEVFNNCIASSGVVQPEDFSHYFTRAVDSDPDLETSTVVKIQGGSDVTLDTVRTELETDVEAPYSLNIDDLFSGSVYTEIQDQASAHKGAGASGDALYETGGTGMGLIIMNATRCVMKHAARTTLQDHLSVADLSAEEQQAVLMALRLNIAQTTTEMLYHFLKEKLMLAQLDLQNAGAVSSRRATPPHILSSMDTLIKLVENQISNMQAMRRNQEGVSKVISAVQLRKGM